MNRFLKTIGLLLCGGLFTATGWAETLYFNRLSGTTIVPADTYGDLELAKDVWATAYEANTSLPNTADAPDRWGTVTTLIEKGDGSNTNIDTHTLAGWFYISALPSQGNYQDLWLLTNGGGAHYGYKVAVDSTGKLRVGRSGTNWNFNDTDSRSYSESNTACVSAKTWVHIALVLERESDFLSGGDATTTRRVAATLYVNGVKSEMTGKVATGCNGNPGATLYIASGISAAGIYVDSTAMSPDDIKATAVDAKYVDYLSLVNGLQQYYSFDSGNDTTEGAYPVNLNGPYVAADNAFGEAFGKGLAATGGINGTANSVAIPETGNFTAAFWYKLNAVPTANKLLVSRGAVQSTTNYAHGWGVWCTTEGKLRLDVYDDKENSVASTAGTLIQYTTNSPVYTQDSLSHHIAWTRDGATIKLYVDGTLVETSATGGTLSASSKIGVKNYVSASGSSWWCNELRVNASPWADNNVTQLAAGEAFDELAFWNVALTQNQVKTLTTTSLKTVFENEEFVRELAAESETWSTSTAWPSGRVPGDNALVALNVTAENGSTLSMDQTASLRKLTINGTAPLTITTDSTTEDVEKLTADTTVINTDTTVAAGAATLDAVTIASGKKLSIETSDSVGEVTFEDATSTLELSGENSLTSLPDGVCAKMRV